MISGPVCRALFEHDSTDGSNRVDFEHLVAVVVDDLHGDLAHRGRIKGITLRAVERCPLGLVDLGLEGALELAVRVIGPGEIGVADEEALAVVIGVEEPTGNVVSRATPNRAGRRVVDIHYPSGPMEISTNGCEGRIITSARKI